MSERYIRIRTATLSDVDAIMPVFFQARAAIAALGIDQWQDGYPTEGHIAEDIEKGYGYVLCVEGVVQGYFALLFDPEPTYEKIFDGAWMTEGPYVTVHRVAMSDALRGKGGAAEAIQFVVSHALRAGVGAVRIDTHHGNLRMRKFLEKQGFAACGAIYLQSGAARVAYERDLRPILQMAPTVLYEDRSIVICEKPVGQPSQPDPVHADGSDLYSCLQNWRSACGYSGQIFLVHRLDTATGGAILFAKDRDSAARLGGMVVGKQIHKQYLAVVHGVPNPAEGRMDDYLYHDKAKNKAFVVDSARKGVKLASLRYRMLAQNGDCSLVEVTLETGRTHQIRAQFSHAGHPLLGDGKYGSREKGCTTALWATHLEVVHPVNKRIVGAESKPPKVYPWNLFDI
ncbi:MAG: GNAT family N-acetyltransferase [Clostridia bacterium]|nr:GNAT family N-acetyltransferase [Clostridia bacterium]